jgi:hypothetical protein
MVKRIEHYWKGLSAPRTQISAIPPQPYGDRFINFITGITMTSEEAQRRETQETNRVGERIPVRSASSENLAGASDATSPLERESPAVERTMRKAQKQTDKATPAEKGRSGSEEEKPDRVLRTTDDSRASMTLPVVSESNENVGLSEKRALSPPDEAEEEENEKTPPQSSSAPTSSSTPGLRKVSPSTVATASDMDEDDTTVSSPPAHQGEFDPQVHDDDDYDHSQRHSQMVDEISEKPPRIASDLIQPRSPLEASMFSGLDHQLRDSMQGH